MKTFRTKFFVLAPLFFLVTPVIAIAATAASGAGLVPCGVSSPGDFLTATECNLCNFEQLIQNIINYLIILSVPISIALFAWAGILYFTSAGNPTRIEKARKIFTSVFIGFVIALSGWLIVQVLLNALVQKNFFLGGNWNTLQCSDAVRPRTGTVSGILTPILGGISVVQTPPSATNNIEVSAAIPAICQLESGCGKNVDNGNGTGCNSAGACGPMQIMPTTACSTNPSFSSGCSSDGKTVLNQQQVAEDLQNVQNSQALAAQILTTAQTSSLCNGSADCAIALYAQGTTALVPSACCVGGPAYACPFDCGTTVAHSFQCDVNPVSACVQTSSCTAASLRKCSAYGYIQLVHKNSVI